MMIRNVPVTLSWDDAEYAAIVGVKRQIEALKAGRRDAHGFDDPDGLKGWGIHVQGAAAELAIAIARGVEWEATINTFKEGGDVGEDQVRMRSSHTYDLVIRPGDPDDPVYWLVTGLLPRFVVRGWIWGWEGKNDAFVQSYANRPPAWFVPQEYLYAINEYPY